MEARGGMGEGSVEGGRDRYEEGEGSRNGREVGMG